jgi:hypothetical protein
MGFPLGATLTLSAPLGEMMEEQPKATGAQGKIIEHLTGRVSDTPPVEAPITFAAAGIDKNLLRPLVCS